MGNCKGGNCNDRIASTCGKKINAKCVDYEGDFHNESDLTTCDYPNIENVIEDINTTLNEITDALDTSSLGDSCISYTEVGGKITIKEALLRLEEKVCELSDAVVVNGCSPIFTDDISCVGLDFKCLVDPCGEQITSLKGLLQAIIDKSCETE